VLAFGDPAYAPDRRLPRLLASRAEAEAVGDEVFLGARASEAGFWKALKRPWRAVHVACHGVVDLERPLGSSLELAAAPGDDGRIDTPEIVRCRLRTDLVVLSACETARGRVHLGEGLAGFTRAFMLAGAPRVICALWKVDDEATKALMVKFYDLWNPKDGTPGLSAAGALRQAQAFIRAQERWRHPYYWAAWVLWGLPQ
jgi:CHAT domain-containing protein